MQQLQQDTASAALSLACLQPAFIRHPDLLLATASTSRALRHAAQQSSGCHMTVVLPLNTPLSRLGSFAQWLPNHAALVKSLCISAQEPATAHVDGLPWELHLGAALLLLQQAMQLAAVPPAAAAAAAAAAEGGAVQGQQRQQGLRLVSFSSNWRGTPELLAALPAHSLTQLTLDLGWASRQPAAAKYHLNSAAATAALARLSSLQRLTLANTDFKCVNAASCLAAVAQLTQLTLLDLAACDVELWPGEEDGPLGLRALLPALAQLRVLRLPFGCVEADVDFRHMTQLQELVNDHGCFYAQLPAQLQRLNFGVLADEDVEAVAQLQQLQRLTFLWQLDMDGEQQPALMQLLQPLLLPALQHLSIEFGDMVWAAAAAFTWAQLPQLRELVLWNRKTDQYYRRPVPREEWEAIRSGLAAATSLTKLLLGFAVRPYGTGYWRHSAEPGEAVAACGALAGLTRLADLDIAAHLLPGDAMALSALTGLTRLVLAGAGEGVGDEAAVALAASCRQLRHLDLSRCNLHSIACLAEVGRLSQLTQLRLEGNAGVVRQGVMQLTGLVQLQQLGVDRQGDVTDEAVKGFWAALRGASGVNR